MNTEAKLLRLAEMAHRDGSIDLIETYAANILADAQRAGGRLPRINRSVAHDLRGLADVLMSYDERVSGLVEEVLELAYPLTEEPAAA